MARKKIWNAWKTYEDGKKRIQVMPNDDLREHLEDDCWCNPESWSEEDQVIHNSMDGREKYEKEGNKH